MTSHRSYIKDTKDAFGDVTRVYIDMEESTVYTTSTSAGDTVEMAFTPARARKLGRRLLKAAEVAEGNS